MPCVHVELPGGGHAIVKLARRRDKCSVRDCDKPHIALCDHEIAPGVTCDARLCDRHAYHMPGNRDFCPKHAPGAEGDLL
jgi:hypothetical protein